LPLKTRDIRNALTSKGFQESKKRDHYYYFFFHEGKKTSVFTKISHGEREVSDNLCSQMAKQTRLTNGQFQHLVDCDLTHEGYIESLIKQDILEPEPKPQEKQRTQTKKPNPATRH
jgi:predicted RNA binding protein YcfA (HicA-like mRNA interferase family)